MLRLLALMTVFLPASLLAQEGFQQLFNGKDLTGWSGDPTLWSVEDGCITGKTNGPDHLKYNKFLIWEGSAADFEFRCEFRLEGENNSGVQYRSVHDKERGEFVCVGYQADIHANPPFTGMLYDEKGRGIIAKRGEKVVVTADGKKQVTKLEGEVKPVDLTEWHELTIVARGNHLVHKIDGVVTVDVTDNQKAEAETEGVIAFQVHRGKAMKAQFRNVRLKKLPPPARARKKKAAKQPPRPEESTASWIWLKENGGPAKRVYFRKEVDSSGVAAARLYAACDDVMKIFVDGKEVISHGNWQKPVFVDISKHLDLDNPEKKHVIAVEAENGASEAGLLIKLDLESGWRDAWSIVTDGSWQASTTPQKGWKTRGFRAGDSWGKPQIVAALGQGPWAKAINAETLAAAAPLKEPTATPVDQLKVAKGFQVELLYTVPKDTQGSWVNMCVDPIGRLIVSDQYGALYRVTPPKAAYDNDPKENTSKGRTHAADDASRAIVVEKINVDIGEAQGLLWAFDSLYVSVNKGKKYEGGLYRVRDTDNDDQLDSVEQLRKLVGTGEHGPHAVLPHPDGKSLVLVCGNRTEPAEITASRLPTWDEDLLLPRVQGKFMRGTRAPGGCIYRIDPDGKNFELLASGFRNQFDAAFNPEGELFTYDADMEWDINTPWYRPTRICHVVSGADFGWRSGGGKWPVYYPDSVPPVINIGPGSPTGVCFGFGALFPVKYQEAMYACDWSYGKMYAVHIPPDGAAEGTKLEEFITGTPLPLTDVVINPFDGAMYFTIGGRRVQSGLYRVTHKAAIGFEARRTVARNAFRLAREKYLHKVQANAKSRKPVFSDAEIDSVRLTMTSAEAAFRETLQPNPVLRKTQRQRRELENLHAPGNHADQAWPHLGSTDRKLRYAARIALEHSPLETFLERALNESDAQTKLAALLAVARKHERTDKGEAPDIDTPIPNWQDVSSDSERSGVTSKILAAIEDMDVSQLSEQQKLELLRVLTLTFVRISPPNAEERAAIIKHLEAAFPATSQALNSELAQLIVYLQAPYAATRLVAALEAAPSQEEQIDYARTLRHLTTGWTPDLQDRYFRWFTRAATYEGGSSFQLFVTNIRNEAVAKLTPEEKSRLKPILEAKPDTDAPDFTSKPRPFVRDWTMKELVPLMETGLKDRDFDHGRRLFGEAKCFACHRFDNQGGSVGPDLTSLSGRFSARDLLESILEPSKQISDQYGSVQIITLGGKIVSGRIINLAGDSVRVQTDMLRPGKLTAVDRKQIDEIIESRVSMMPKGLLNNFEETEILDLMAYLLSRGDRSHAMFSKRLPETSD